MLKKVEIVVVVLGIVNVTLKETVRKYEKRMYRR